MTNVFFCLQAEIRIILPGFEMFSGLSASPAYTHRVKIKFFAEYIRE
jgi:hypothetical protein